MAFEGPRAGLGRPEQPGPARPLRGPRPSPARPFIFSLLGAGPGPARPGRAAGRPGPGRGPGSPGRDQSMLVMTNSKKYIKQMILCDKIFIYKENIKRNP